MRSARVYADLRDNVLYYEEEFDDGIRRAGIACDSNESVSIFMVPLYLLGWKSKTTLYRHSLRGWSYGSKRLPFGPGDRERVLQAFVDHELSRGCRVKIDDEKYRKEAVEE